MNTNRIEPGRDAQLACVRDPSPSRNVHAKIGAPLPAAPRSLDETGLGLSFVAGLVLKSTLIIGRASYGNLIERHGLPLAVLDDVFTFLVREHLVELAHRGTSDLDVSFRLTDAGRALARAEQARSSYSGPAPVTLDAYLACMDAHSVRKLRITRADVLAAFDGIVVAAGILDAAAAALNAGRPLLIHGPAGSGKTFLAERLGMLMHGYVPVPHAVLVGDEVIQIHDPLVHVDAASPPDSQSFDRRWRLCKRPVVMSGGELTLGELDLRRDDAAGFYQAPPHMKANMGMYVVDDLGRQRVEPRDLLNRWLRPLDRGVDFLTLESGHRFVLPFDVWPVFSSNIAPDQLGDDAFLRRLGSKVHVGPLSIDDYRAVFDAACVSHGLTPAHGAFEYLLHHLHLPSGKAFLACVPEDLLRLVAAGARYRGDPPEVTPDVLHDAWAGYFGAAPERDGSQPPPVERAGHPFVAG